MRFSFLILFFAFFGCAVEERVSFRSFVYDQTEGVCRFELDSAIPTVKTFSIPEKEFHTHSDAKSVEEQFAVVTYYPEIFWDRVVRMEIHYFLDSEEKNCSSVRMEFDGGY